MKKPHYFFNPFVAILILLTALNDHVFKYQYPSFLTGILSDLTGLFFFPLLVAAFLETWKSFRVSQKQFNWLAVMTGVLFISFKFIPFFQNALVSVFRDYLFAIKIVSDPKDLLALISLPLVCAWFKAHDTRGNQIIHAGVGFHLFPRNFNFRR